VIEDPIPAGADAGSTRICSSRRVSARSQGWIGQKKDPLSHGWGWWWFSNIEMRDEKVVMYATYLPPRHLRVHVCDHPSLAVKYNVIPTTGFEFYFLKCTGARDGMLFTITGRTTRQMRWLRR